MEISFDGELRAFLDHAMTIWQVIEEKTRRDVEPTVAVWENLRTMRLELDTSEIRMRVVELVPTIMRAYAIATADGDPAFLSTFETHFVPTFLECALETNIKNSDFYLKADWPQIATAFRDRTNSTEVSITLTRRQQSAVIAALRLMQAQPGTPFSTIASNEGEFPPLSAEEIDALCEDINTAPDFIG